MADKPKPKPAPRPTLADHDKLADEAKKILKDTKGGKK